MRRRSATITPGTLVEGQAATITGTKFGASAGANVVRVGGVAASVTAATTTSLQIIVPKLNCKPAQNINVDVTVAGNTSAPKAQPFTPGATFSLAQGQQRLISVPTNFCLQFACDERHGEVPDRRAVGVAETVTSVTSANVTSEVPAAGRRRCATDHRDSAGVFRIARQSHRRMTRALAAGEASRRRRRADRPGSGAVRGTIPGARDAAALAQRASRRRLPTVPGTAKVGDVTQHSHA